MSSAVGGRQLCGQTGSSMQRAAVLVTLLTVALAGPLSYDQPPPPNTYVPPEKSVPTRINQIIDVPPQPADIAAPRQPVFSRPVPEQPVYGRPPPAQPPPIGSRPSAPAGRVPVSGSAAQIPLRYTELDYTPDVVLNRNPGTGGSGPMGVFVGACSASTVCVPEPMCNPYTGFVRGGLLREPTGPSGQPTVAILRCYRLKDGGVGDGVCCRMPHINDPWPDQQ